LFIILISGAVFLWAGDTASFVDLGFSPDGKIYAFAQYGVQSGDLRPWAELCIVDVPANNFVSGGRISYIHDKPINAGQDGSGALYRLLTANAALLGRYGVNYLDSGLPLFISLEEPGSPPAHSIEYRDFEAGASYRATIVSTLEGTGARLTSSFIINLDRTGRDGSKKSYRVGTPTVKRPLIVSYRIRKAIIAPHDGSMILVIEMQKQNGADFDIRFMVEAVRL